jgi:hypothetical protein
VERSAGIESTGKGNAYLFAFWHVLKNCCHTA